MITESEQLYKNNGNQNLKTYGTLYAVIITLSLIIFGLLIFAENDTVNDNQNTSIMAPAENYNQREYLDNLTI